MDTLYIIGNGFDLHHDLPTRYCNFHNFVSKNYPDLENELEEYFTLKTGEKYLWTNFEGDLGTFDYQAFFANNNNLDIHNDSFRPSYSFALEDELTEQSELLRSEIKKVFQEWLESIDLSTISSRFTFKQNSTFITFNYTHILEEVYKIDSNRILHIHGDIVNTPEELIFGHNLTLEEIPELDENGDSSRTLFTDSENSAKSLFYDFQKPVDAIISNNCDAFASVSKVHNIFIIGHSLNPIDIPYFKLIFENSPNSKWTVSYHLENEKIEHLNTLVQLGIPSTRITFFKL